MYLSNLHFLMPTAVMVAQPTDIVKVRFQAHVKPDVQLCPEPKPSTWMAYKTIFTQEGLAGLWRGERVKFPESYS